MDKDRKQLTIYRGKALLACISNLVNSHLRKIRIKSKGGRGGSANG